ncbi:MAG: hypothetical protein M3352_12585 [Bacteroidota bacterium]|nr:hypothetical protein [Bacteroidota bacterium]
MPENILFTPPVYEKEIDNRGFLSHFRDKLKPPVGEAIAQNKAPHQQGCNYLLLLIAYFSVNTILSGRCREIQTNILTQKDI